MSPCAKSLRWSSARPRGSQESASVVRSAFSWQSSFRYRYWANKISTENRGRRYSAAATRVKRLVDRANSAWISGAAGLSRTNVDRVAPVVCRLNVGERVVVAFRIHLHAIADCGALLCGIDEDSRHSTCGNIDDIVDGPASVRKSADISCKKAKTFLASDRGWRNARV